MSTSWIYDYCEQIPWVVGISNLSALNLESNHNDHAIILAKFDETHSLLLLLLLFSFAVVNPDFVEGTEDVFRHSCYDLRAIRLRYHLRHHWLMIGTGTNVKCILCSATATNPTHRPKSWCNQNQYMCNFHAAEMYTNRENWYHYTHTHTNTRASFCRMHQER